MMMMMVVVVINMMMMSVMIAEDVLSDSGSSKACRLVDCDDARRSVNVAMLCCLSDDDER